MLVSVCQERFSAGYYWQSQRSQVPGGGLSGETWSERRGIWEPLASHVWSPYWPRSQLVCEVCP